MLSFNRTATGWLSSSWTPLAHARSKTAFCAPVVASQAASVQSALNFTRDNEREADRVGFQTLEQAGLDPQAMPLFFERLQRAFSTLPDEYREVITLARVVGLPHAEIAVKLGKSEGAVRILLHRALARLAHSTGAEA